MDAYSAQDAIRDIAVLWDKLTKAQQKSVAKMFERTKKQNNTPLKDQISVDEFLAELEEDYRRKAIEIN